MNDKLHDEFAAYAFAGFDSAFTFFRLYTLPIMRGGKEGMFEYSWQDNFARFQAANDKRAWLFAATKVHLAHCIRRTGIPLEKWVVEYSPVMAELNIPSHLYLSKPEDCKWLL